jgi:hypothetical protein
MKKKKKPLGSSAELPFCYGELYLIKVRSAYLKALPEMLTSMINVSLSTKLTMFFLISVNIQLLFMAIGQ